MMSKVQKTPVEIMKVAVNLRIRRKRSRKRKREAMQLVVHFPEENKQIPRQSRFRNYFPTETTPRAR